MESKRDYRYSVLMFPWLAHGHISPFLELSKRLSDRNFHVYLCSTPVNFTSIKNRITHKYSLSITMVELHLPSLPELPPHYHTTNGLPLHLNKTLRKASKMARPDFSNLLKTLNPDFLIYDVLLSWAPGVATAQNIPAIPFVLSSAAMVSFSCHHMITPGTEYPFPAICLREYGMTRLRQMINSASRHAEEDRDSDPPERPPLTNLMLMKTFGEIEEKYVKHVAGLIKREIMAVGPLVQDPSDHHEDKNSGEFSEWLDGKEELSTVLVSFGSEYFLSKEEIVEIAHGLELSEVNFIWVIRFPMGEEKKTRVGEALPLGFKERVEERGMVVEGWAPQAKILGHKSVAGFVSHCGWNSVLEGMKFGVPLVAMPMHLDQPVNARLAVEVGVAVEVLRDEDGGVQREEVARVIREVVVGENCGGFRERARELSENMRLRGDVEVDGLVEVLAQLHQKNKHNHVRLNSTIVNYYISFDCV